VSRVLTLGETMALIDPIAEGPLERGSTLTLRIAGAESNFAIALARLGIPTTWISRVGRDRFGELIVSALAGEGVDVEHVRRDPEAPTGIFFKWRQGGRSNVLYYRHGSAAARLEPEDVDAALLEGVELVHLTGITMALGASARELVVDVARQAQRQGALVTFDPNWRPTLWPSLADAQATQAQVLPFVDWYLCGEDEGRTLFGADDAPAVEAAARAAGAGDAVVRVGARGAFVGGELVPLAHIAEVVDEIGAGDGFAAGFVYGLLHGFDPRDCARAGNAIASAALAGTGDWETYPYLDEVAAALRPAARPAAGAVDRGRAEEC